MKVTVVGGGTSGYSTALILKTKYPNYDIEIVKSSKIGIVGVGEGSTEHWGDFIDFVGISWKDMVTECDSTIKAGIMFEGFSDKPYMHSVNHMAGIEGAYLKLISEECDKFDLNDSFFVESKIPKLLEGVDITKQSPTYQYHFNTFKLNEYLHKVAVERGITVFEDDIERVDVYRGEILSITGERKYVSDFYIDSTGFRKLLIGELGAEWQPHTKWLKTNEAIAFPTPDTDDYPTYTKVKAMKYGWMWNTPTNGRWGNGYVYNNEYIDSEEAKKEVEEVLGHEIEIFKNIRFTPGAVDRPWIGNCVAIGLSANFVEPLEASAISTGIQQSFLLTDYLENYTPSSIIEYNKRFNYLIENIKDFVILHFLSKREDTEFWKNAVTISDTLQEKLDKWEYRLPNDSDFEDINLILFKPENFIQIMYGLDLFNIKELKKRYSEFQAWQKDFETNINNYLTDRKKEIATAEYIGHKEYLRSMI